jgi:hypothetical protein
MNESEFEAQLKADVTLKSKCKISIRALGKTGWSSLAALLSIGLASRLRLGPGQIFAVADGELHDEWIGPEGANVLVGRKFAPDRR